MITSSLDRVLICGLGSIGRRHLRVLRSLLPNLEISVLRSGFGLPCEEIRLADNVFTNLRDAQMWQPQAAIIATPATDHLSKALPLAKNGVPLLIEKPLTSDSESRNKLIELKNLAPKVPIVLAYVLRHDPCALYVKELLASGVLGTLIDAGFYCGSWLPDWRPGLNYRNCVSARSDQGGGVLLEISHEIDLAYWFFGEINLHSSFLRQSDLLDIDVEDQAVLVGSTSSGATLSMNLNFCTKPAKRLLCVRGNRGEIIWEMINGKVQLSHEEPDSCQSYTSSVSADERYTIQALHFLSCVERAELPRCSVEDGIRVLELIQKARQQSSSLIG